MEHLILAGARLPVYSIDTLVVGSGCAGYNAADWLSDLGRRDIALLTEGRLMGTSRNTGSDKQTYYKLSLCGEDADSVRALARTLYEGGGVDGDTALAEAAGSVRSFIKLCNLGVPFPQNRFGEYAGYKTDHDPRRRATSAGPLTSRYMTEALEASVKAKGVRVLDGMQAVRLIVSDGAVRGLLALKLSGLEGENAGFVLFRAQNVILCTGGPAGLYAQSVYPESQTGMTGMALEAGAAGQSLEQWQYGLASVDFRWNVSGTYQQVLPRYVSVDADGTEHEFLPDYFPSAAQALDHVFLKGYQWPFDVRKIPGSSLIDLTVHRETQELGRRVYLDFTRDPRGLEEGFGALGAEAREYLARSGALQRTPIARLRRMNPAAVELYASHGIDLSRDRLRVAVCAQHCNGGIAVDENWRTSLAGLYAAGEAAGTFGVYRPGGSALNAAQVGSMRAAEHIAYTTREGALCAPEAFSAAAQASLEELVRGALDALQRARGGGGNLLKLRQEGQRRMSRCAAHIRSPKEIEPLLRDTRRELERFWEVTRLGGAQDLAPALKNRDFLITRAAVLASMLTAHGRAGSLGAGLWLSPDGNALPGGLRVAPSRADCSGERVVTRLSPDGTPNAVWEPVREMPQPDDWFENVWRGYRERTAGLHRWK